MPQYFATATMPDVSGVPADAVELSLQFTAGAASDASAALNAFLIGTTQPGLTPLAGYLSNTLSRIANAVIIKVYDIGATLAGTPHGSPVFTSVTTLTAPLVGSDIPNQIAMVGSYHADLTGLSETGPSATLPTPEEAIDFGAPATHSGITRPRARHRGRLFFGPLNTAAASGDGSVAPVAHTALNASMQYLTPGAVGAGTPPRLVAGLNGLPGGITWNVWSRRNAAVFAVTGGYVAEEFGAIDRRRETSRARTLWSV